MAILRSRTPTAEQAHSPGTSTPDRAIAGWQDRVAAAHAEGLAEGLRQAEARIQAAERRADEAEAKARDEIERQRTAIADEHQARLGGAIRALAAAAEACSSLERQLAQEAEADAVRLGCLVAERILRREIETDPAWIRPVLTAALVLIPDKRGVAVRLHPEDAEVARLAKKSIAEQVPGLDRLEIFDDANLDRGACVVASQGTRLDASLPASWERMAKALLESAPHPPLEAAPPDQDAGGATP